MGSEPVRRRSRGVLAVVLIVLGSLLVPVAVVAGWARSSLLDTDAFVARAAPLIDDVRVQNLVTDAVAEAIEARVTVGPLAGRALRAATADVVASDAFATAWRESLRVSHGQLVSALDGDPAATLAISRDGLGLQLGPLVERVKAGLVDRGYRFATLIPTVDKTVVLIRGDSLVSVQTVYRVVRFAGDWLGLVCLALLTAGVLASVRRTRAMGWTAVGLGFGATVVFVMLAVVRMVAPASVPVDLLSPDVVLLVIDTLTAGLGDAAFGVLALAFVAGVGVWSVRPALTA
ncbi:hypothetical protein [Propionicicella superfundia]|uniref:hypothetical protein n=1 Tax=Propionicicella superfundia TaxID=348582 RepID=UPI0012ECB268|nr:hypothetical protein [Propionicicella superfundia]